MKKAEITIFLVTNFFKSGNTHINEKISQPYDDNLSFLDPYEVGLTYLLVQSTKNDGIKEPTFAWGLIMWSTFLDFFLSIMNIPNRKKIKCLQLGCK